VTAFPTDHLAPPEVLSGPAPLGEVAPARRRTPAEEARTLVARNRMAALATLSEDGSPWGSLVLYAALEDGTPVLCLSTLAEHGRNITRDTRASLVVGEADVTGDPLDSGRVTLAGRLETPEGEELDAARAAYKAASPASGLYGGFGDFTYYVLRVGVIVVEVLDRVRGSARDRVGLGGVERAAVGGVHAAVASHPAHALDAQDVVGEVAESAVEAGGG
jgi:heme iron utilization protein